MKAVVLIFASLSFLAAETFPVVLKKTAWADGEGSVTLNEKGISFDAKKPQNSRHWEWLDVQHFDRVSETEFIVLTYEDRKRYLGRDRSYRFVITDGALSDELHRGVSEWLSRPVTNRVVRESSAVRYSVPVKHRHSLGGCEGELRFTDTAVYYHTEHAKDAREWLLGRDVESVWSANLYQMELHVFERNRREFSRSRIFKFDLKRPLDTAFYRDLKLTLYQVRQHP